MSIWEAWCYGAVSADDEIKIAVIVAIAILLALWEAIKIMRARCFAS